MPSIFQNEILKLKHLAKGIPDKDDPVASPDQKIQLLAGIVLSVFEKLDSDTGVRDRNYKEEAENKTV